MARFFSLGCSFTQYHYPTWADWIGSHFDHYENLGKVGAGNRFIFNRLCELVYKKRINHTDYISIIWSTPIREDRWYSGEGWKTLGNIYNQKFYPTGWVYKYFDPFMALMETINYVHGALNILDNLGCKHASSWMMIPTNISSVVEINLPESYMTLCDPEQKLIPYLEYVLQHENISEIDMFSFCNNFQKKYTENFEIKNALSVNDLHPKPIEHYYYAKEILCPLLNVNNFDESGELLNLAKHWTMKEFDSDFKGENPKWPKNSPACFDGY